MKSVIFSYLVDGQWSQWGMYGKCSVTCGGGFKYRSRKCDNPAPASGGKNCQGPSFQSVVCETQACPGKFLFFSFSHTHAHLGMSW